MSEQNKKPIVTIEMENGGVIKVELEPALAPNTVRNFISLANSGFYNGIIFHRVIPGFMIQGGCPEGTGRGGPGYVIEGEFGDNGHKENTLRHKRGVISMARRGGTMWDPTLGYNTAGSQFFIMVADASHLDDQYAAFGRVTEGMEVADAIVASPRDRADRPYEDQRMKSVTVETFGVEYPAPDKLPE